MEGPAIDIGMTLEPYLEAKVIWPSSGKFIQGQYDDDCIIVYQAYNPTIGISKISQLLS